MYPPTANILISTDGNGGFSLDKRERAMIRFLRMRTSQKFVAVYASIRNHFSAKRHLYNRSNFKLNSAAALTEWRKFSVV